MASGYNKKKMEIFANEVDQRLCDINGCLDRIVANIEKIETGENGVAYWSGKKAREYMQLVRRYVKKDIEVYNAYVDFITKFSSTLKSQKDN